jgi:hypothetical protein|tara:strand:- start:912 stop:1412 length:501 start_codon:yes stop_codon:yes gene_type:complete
MNDPRLVALTDRLNKYVALIRTENPNMSEKDIVDRAAHMALTDQKSFEAKAGIIPTDAVADRFGDGTRIESTEDGSSIVRVDNAWQQSKGSKISSDGFHKKDHSTITMPKDIDITTPEGDKRAGKFVEELKAAKKRGQKLQAAAERDAWDNRKVQIIVDKDVSNGN